MRIAIIPGDAIVPATASDAIGTAMPDEDVGPAVADQDVVLLRAVEVLDSSVGVRPPTTPRARDEVRDDCVRRVVIEGEVCSWASVEEIVRDISKAKQEIISYRKIVKPQRPALRLLERRVERFLPEELELYFDDLVDASERIWDLLDNYKEVVEALEATNESAISHRQNDVLRLLTLISVTMLPLTVITGVFGMNVLFPGEGSHTAFWLILGVMGLALAGMVGFFRYKRWI